MYFIKYDYLFIYFILFYSIIYLYVYLIILLSYYKINHLYITLASKVKYVNITNYHTKCYILYIVEPRLSGVMGNGEEGDTWINKNHG